MSGLLSHLHEGAISERQAVIESIGFDDNTAEFEVLAAAAKTAKKRAASTRSSAPVESGPKRTSSRIRGVDPEGNVVEKKENTFETRSAEGDVDLLDFISPPRSLEKKNDGRAILESVIQGVKNLKLSGAVSLSQTHSSIPSVEEAVRSTQLYSRVTSVSDFDTCQLTDEKFVGRVLPEVGNRVYSVGLHPSEDRIIGIQGGRFGELSLWQPLYPGYSNVAEAVAAVENEEVEEDASDSKRKRRRLNEPESSYDPLKSVVSFSIHTGNINGFLVPPSNPTQIYTASYDGSMRIFDLERLRAIELLEYHNSLPSCLSLLSPAARAPSKPSKKDILSGADTKDEVVSVRESVLDGKEERILDDPRTLVVGTRKGHVLLVDTRKKGGLSGSFYGHSKKITAVSVQAGSHILSSASADGSVKIWDARRAFSSSTSTSKAGTADLETPLGQALHLQAVTGVSFSPDGRLLASVANDNKVRVWDLLQFAGSASDGKTINTNTNTSGGMGPVRAAMYHNNHTGRWLAPFKISWVPSLQSTIALANMRRGIDLITVHHSDSKPATVAGFQSHNKWSMKTDFTASGDLLTAVPSMCAAHNTLPLLIGGTASGRAYIFQPTKQ